MAFQNMTDIATKYDGISRCHINLLAGRQFQMYTMEREKSIVSMCQESGINAIVQMPEGMLLRRTRLIRTRYTNMIFLGLNTFTVKDRATPPARSSSYSWASGRTCTSSAKQQW